MSLNGMVLLEALPEIGDQGAQILGREVTMFQLLELVFDCAVGCELGTCQRVAVLGVFAHLRVEVLLLGHEMPDNGHDQLLAQLFTTRSRGRELAVVEEVGDGRVVALQ